MTFRNIHNFLDQDKSDNIFNSINKSLKKGGILGVVQHRADKSLDLEFSKGYVKESFIIDQIESHGFELVEKSNINSNPKAQTIDYIDPIQGKIAGAAEEELTYKTHYDPAVYTTGTATPSTVIDAENYWADAYVGKLWWDLSTAKFVNPCALS